MEKRGELLNQLAIISDLLEKINLNAGSTTIIFELSNSEFDRVYEYIGKKQNVSYNKPKDKFTITIGNIDMVFSTNNV